MSEHHPIFDAKLAETGIAVFDLETTGLHSSRNAIIQMAVVNVEAADLDREWASLVNPGGAHRPIPSFIEDFTGIKDGDLDNAPNLSDAMQTFDNVVETRFVAGHNIKSFDLKFIRRAEIKTGVDVQTDYYIDTLRLMRKLYPDLDGHKLSDCGEFYGIDFDAGGLHNALEDTRLCAKVLIRQIDDLSERGVKTFGDMLSFLSG